MSFLTPIFLLGAVAVALPVLFHLIRRSVRERTVFSSLMFLQPSPPRLTRRSRLENLLLLALRCAALCLLALGFARPFLKQSLPQPPASGSRKQVLVLVDTSASMRRQSLWNEGRRKVEQVIRKTTPADLLCLCSFDRQLKVLISFEQWAATTPGNRQSLALGRVSDLAPGWSDTALDAALTQAAELFPNSEKQDLGAVRQVVVISDFQEGSRITALQGHQWPNGLEVIPERVVPGKVNNAGIQLVSDPTDAPVSPESAVRVRITNASDSKREQFQVAWAGISGSNFVKPVNVYVPAGQSRIVSIPNPPTNSSSDRIVLSGDDEPFDNTVYVMPPERVDATVIYVGSDSDTDNRQPLFFLKRALQDTRRQRIRVVNQLPSVPLTLAQAQAAALLIVTAPVEGNQAGVLRDALAAGKTVLFAPLTPEAAATLGSVFAVSPLAVTDAKLQGYAMLAEIDFNHPLFAPFADARFSDFTRIHFWNYRKLDDRSFPAARTVARFDTGSPAIVEISSGKGKAILFTSGWQPADSQLALSSKFVPLLYSLIESGDNKVPPPQQYFVGSAISVPSGAKAWSPGGAMVPLDAGGTNLVLLEPGIYSVESGQSTAKLAVNLEPSESRTGPLPADELERLGVPGPRPAVLTNIEAKRKVRLQSTELEARQKLWRWFITTTLVLLCFETWLAGRTTRRAVLKEGPA